MDKCITFVATAVIFAAICLLLPDNTLAAYSVGTSVTCSNDTDCTNSANETYCYKVATSCSKGYCSCRTGFYYDQASQVCKAALNLGATCTGAPYEAYLWGALCNNSLVVCQSPVYTQSGSTCVQVQSPVAYSGTCVQVTTNVTQSCNATAGMTCDSTPKCVCSLPTSIYSSSSGICRPRTFGDSCSATSDCDSGSYTNLLAAGGGPNCTSSTCGCATGFTQVAYLNYDTVTKTTSGLNACLKNYTSGIGLNGACTLQPASLSTNGSLVCSTSYACIRCQEDTSTSTQGLCRSISSSSNCILTASSSSSVSSLSAASLISAIKACSGQGRTISWSLLVAICVTTSILFLLFNINEKNT